MDIGSRVVENPTPIKKSAVGSDLFILAGPLIKYLDISISLRIGLVKSRVAVIAARSLPFLIMLLCPSGSKRLNLSIVFMICSLDKVFLKIVVQ